MNKTLCSVKNNESVCRTVTCLSILFALAIAFAPNASAATFTVTRADDRNQTCAAGDCSLREAVAAANAAATDDTINFAPGLRTISLLIGEIIVNGAGSLTINGSGADVLTIDASRRSRIFQLSQPGRVTITDVTLTGGSDFASAGISQSHDNGALTLDRVNLTGNRAFDSFGAAGVYLRPTSGSGIISYIRNSTISNNTTPGTGGGIYNDGTTLVITNSTISNNAADNIGGGIYNDGTTTLRNVTIANNSSNGSFGIGGGIGNTSPGTIDYGNTIVSGNTSTTGSPDFYNPNGTVTDAGNNFVGGNAMLDPLGYYGGTTPTRRPQPGSPVIDAGSNALANAANLFTDQRNVARFIGAAVDIGAFESSPIAPANLVAWLPGDGDARDLSGGNNNGTIYGATFGIGKVGQAFDFTANGNYAQLPAAAAPTGNSPRTVETWIYTNDASWQSYRTFFHSGVDSNSQAFAIATTGSSNYRAILIYAWYNDIVVNVTPHTSITGWQHIAVAYDGTRVRVVVNGADVGTFNFPGGALNTASSPVLLGNGGGGYEYNERIDEASVYNRALTTTEMQAIYRAGANGKLKQFAFTSQQTVQLAAATINFASAQTGTAQEQGLDGSNLPPVPMGTPRLYYDVTAAGGASGAGASVCFKVPALAAQFANLRVYHLENNVWVDRTASANTAPNLCTSALPSLSPFAIVQQAAPTAASVEIGGRITTAEGRGIRNALVTLTEADGTSRTVVSGSFGHYRFADVSAGQTVTIEVSSKRFVFTQPGQILNVTEEQKDINFVAQ